MSHALHPTRRSLCLGTVAVLPPASPLRAQAARPYLADIHSHLGLIAPRAEGFDMGQVLRAAGVTLLSWNLVDDGPWTTGFPHGIQQTRQPAPGDLWRHFQRRNAAHDAMLATWGLARSPTTWPGAAWPKPTCTRSASATMRACGNRPWAWPSTGEDLPSAPVAQWTKPESRQRNDAAARLADRCRDQRHARTVAFPPLRRAQPPALQPWGKSFFASSSLTLPAMITSSPWRQFTGVATLCLAVGCIESSTRRISSKLRPVVIG